MMASASAVALFHFSSSVSFAMSAAILRPSSSVSVLRLKIGVLSPRYRVATHLPGRDSYRLREAGARRVVMSSPKRWALMHELGGSPEMSFNDAEPAT